MSETDAGVPLSVLVPEMREPARPKRWVLISALGTWNEYASAGEYGHRTGVQELFDEWPYPKLSLRGLGTSYTGKGKFFGGAFAIGAKKRVRQALDFLETCRFDQDTRLILDGHSRGFAVNMAIVRELEKIRQKFERKGHRPPPWTRVDVFIARDPVASMYLGGAWKFATGWMPAKLRWRWNVDGIRQMPSFVEAVIATYAIHERRPAFEPTHLLVGPGKSLRKAWMVGVHADHGQYGEGDQRPGVDVGSYIHTELVKLHPELETVPLRWPWLTLIDEEWERVGASPATRRSLPGDEALVRKVVPP